eukprot:181860-Rhodomonas_salina.1
MTWDMRALDVTVAQRRELCWTLEREGIAQRMVEEAAKGVWRQDNGDKREGCIPQEIGLIWHEVPGLA